MVSIFLWAGFGAFVVAMLALDLGIFNRKSHKIKVKESLILTAFWISLALAFCVLVYFWRGYDTALAFFTGYLIEKSLSVDNLFVFFVLLSFFRVPQIYQHKVLYFGIVGALVTRLAFIMAGITLIENFHWVIYVFGAFLVFTGLKLIDNKSMEVHPERNPVLKLVRRMFPVTKNYVGGRFIVRKGLKYMLTPLLVTVLMVETTDIFFAVDSIPAVFAITLDPFIVYTSNVFAILGLRALYFALAGIIEKFSYLHYGLAAILVFVGAKMLVSDFYTIPIDMSLGVVGSILLMSAAVSFSNAKRHNGRKLTLIKK